MSNKKIKELRNLSKDELVNKTRETEKEIFELRMKKTTGQLADVAKIWRTRKALSRMKTLLTAQKTEQKAEQKTASATK